MQLIVTRQFSCYLLNAVDVKNYVQGLKAFDMFEEHQYQYKI